MSVHKKLGKKREFEEIVKKSSRTNQISETAGPEFMKNTTIDGAQWSERSDMRTFMTNIFIGKRKTDTNVPAILFSG